MNKLFIVLLLSLPTLVYSQININKTKADIKNDINLIKKANPAIQVLIKETDSTMMVSRIFKNKDRSEQLLQFDSLGTCKWDKLSFNNEESMKKELALILSIKKLNWMKINENQYVSDFEDQLMIEIPADDMPTSINIIRMDWNRILYDLMLGK